MKYVIYTACQLARGKKSSSLSLCDWQADFVTWAISNLKKCMKKMKNEKD